MNNKIYTLVMASVIIGSCTSADREGKTDSTQNIVVKDTINHNDTTNTDSTASGIVAATGSMNSSNNSGVNSSDGKPQKAKSADPN